MKWTSVLADMWDLGWKRGDKLYSWLLFGSFLCFGMSDLLEGDGPAMLIVSGVVFVGNVLNQGTQWIKGYHARQIEEKERWEWER